MLDCSNSIEVMFNPPIEFTIPPTSEIILTINANYLVIHLDMNEKKHYLKFCSLIGVYILFITIFVYRDNDTCCICDYKQAESIYLYEKCENEIIKINKNQLYTQINMYEINNTNKYFIDPSLYDEIMKNEYNIIKLKHF